MHVIHTLYLCVCVCVCVCVQLCYKLLLVFRALNHLHAKSMILAALDILLILHWRCRLAFKFTIFFSLGIAIVALYFIHHFLILFSLGIAIVAFYNDEKGSNKHNIHVGT